MCPETTLKQTEPGNLEVKEYLCRSCGRIWYWLESDQLASRPRKVQIVKEIVPGERLDDCIKPIRAGRFRIKFSSPFEVDHYEEIGSADELRMLIKPLRLRESELAKLDKMVIVLNTPMEIIVERITEVTAQGGEECKMN